MIPSIGDTELFVTAFLMPLAVQWWSVWYPGSEPGGGAFVAQRILAAKNEKHAVGATMLFNAAHYALRPWPWILVALASLIVFPDLESLRQAFPHVTNIEEDMAYPAMLTFLPAGLLGLVVASLAAAYMSTLSTLLNLGSSYVVNDLWKRFVRPEASEKELVRVGRVATVVIMALGVGVALALKSVHQGFNILLQIGAGTGLLFILRWFWWRVNPWSEIVAMVVSLAVACVMELVVGDALPKWAKLLASVGVTTIAWMAATFIAPASSPSTLRRFCALIRPGGPGWRRVYEDAEAAGEPIETSWRAWNVPRGLACMVLGCLAVYAMLFGAGCWIYGRWESAGVLTAVAAASWWGLARGWRGLVGER